MVFWRKEDKDLVHVFTKPFEYYVGLNWYRRFERRISKRALYLPLPKSVLIGLAGYYNSLARKKSARHVSSYVMSTSCNMPSSYKVSYMLTY